MYTQQNIYGMGHIDQSKLALSKSQINDVFLKYKSAQSQILKKRANFIETFTNIRIKKDMTPFKLIYDDSEKKITDDSISIIPLLRFLVLSKIQHLSEIQYEVDVFENKLANVNGKTIHQFIDKILSTQYASIEDLFDSLFKFLQDFQGSKIQLLRPILIEIYRILQTKFDFTVAPDLFYNAMLNTNHNDIFVDENQLKQKNNAIATKISASSTAEKKKKSASNTVISIAYLLLKRRKKVLGSNHFFSIIEEDQAYDYDQIINDSFDQQVKECQKLINKKN